MVKSMIRSALRVMTTAWKQQIGVAVREARRQAGLTQEQLAERLRMTPEAISNIERGRSLPELPTLHALSQALRMPMSALISEPPEEPKSVKRATLERRLMTLSQSLDDKMLEIAVKQVAALGGAPQS